MPQGQYKTLKTKSDYKNSDQKLKPDGLSFFIRKLLCRRAGLSVFYESDSLFGKTRRKQRLCGVMW
jgi:hypothetical protein